MMKKFVIKLEFGCVLFVDVCMLKLWFDCGYDDIGCLVVMFDMCNVFEVDVGMFDNVFDYWIDKFSEFLEVIDVNCVDFEGKMVVLFCIGGICCEKVVIYMKEIGIDNVY